jgi:hypothetical protein
MSAAEMKATEEVDSTKCDIGYFISERKVIGLKLREIELHIKGESVEFCVGSSVVEVETKEFSHFLVCMLGILDPDSLREDDEAKCAEVKG